MLFEITATYVTFSPRDNGRYEHTEKVLGDQNALDYAEMLAGAMNVVAVSAINAFTGEVLVTWDHQELTYISAR